LRYTLKVAFRKDNLMSLSKKLLTAVRLLVRLDFATLRRQWKYHKGQYILGRHGSEPFMHRAAGHRLICFPDHPDSVVQYLEGGDDQWELALLRRWLQPGDGFVDAGANLGLYAHAMAGHFAGQVQVLALEASPDLVARLKLGTHLLGEKNLQSVQVAVGAENGEVAFYLARPGGTTVSQSINIAATESGDYERHMLPMQSLAALAARYFSTTRIEAVKIDVEGAEPLALRGAPAEWRGENGPLWLVEINLPVLARMNFQPSDVLCHFPKTSFECWILPKYPFAGNPPERPRLLAVDEGFADARFYNLIAVPNGPAAEARRAHIRGLFP
jgi:FkbM family methyltransferase